MLKILTAKSLPILEEQAKELEIEQVGSLSISNGHFFLALLIKDKPRVTKVTPKVTKDTEEKPKETPKKRTSKRKPKVSSSSA